MQQTTNYQLPQWEATDQIKRSDFNGAMATLDTAVKAAANAAAAAQSAASGGAKVAVGSYTGNGTKGSANAIRLTFSFTPKLVLLFPGVTSTGKVVTDYANSQYTPAYLIWGVTDQMGSSSNNPNTVTYSGNTVSWWNNYSESSQHNVSGYIYHYVAIG